MASLRKKYGRYAARFYDKRRSPKRKEIAALENRVVLKVAGIMTPATALIFALFKFAAG